MLPPHQCTQNFANKRVNCKITVSSKCVNVQKITFCTESVNSRITFSLKVLSLTFCSKYAMLAFTTKSYQPIDALSEHRYLYIDLFTAKSFLHCRILTTDKQLFVSSVLGRTSYVVGFLVSYQ